MLGKIRHDFQQNLFKTRLTELLNLEHPLVKLSQEIAASNRKKACVEQEESLRLRGRKLASKRKKACV